MSTATIFSEDSKQGTKHSKKKENFLLEFCKIVFLKKNIIIGNVGILRVLASSTTVNKKKLIRINLVCTPCRRIAQVRILKQRTFLTRFVRRPKLAFHIYQSKEGAGMSGTSEVQQIIQHLNQLQIGQAKLLESVKLLNAENIKRADEIKILAKRNGALLIEDEDASGVEPDRWSHSENVERDDRSSRGSENLVTAQPTQTSLMHSMHRAVPKQSSATLIPATDLIRTIEVLNGRDDIGVHDFIRNVKRARAHCSQPDLMLDYIIAEKITDQAKRSIRHTTIGSYGDLYEILRTKLAPINSIELCRSRLENCRQNNDSVQNYSMRFRQLLNELNYAIQAEHQRPSERSIAIKIEERTAIKRYIMNLRDEISTQVRPLRPTTFAQALQDSMEAEAWHRERLRNRGFAVARSVPSRPSNLDPSQKLNSSTHTPNMYRVSYGNPPNHGPPLLQKTAMQCFNCKKVGHLQSQCPNLRTIQGFPQGLHRNRPPQRVNAVESQEEAKTETREHPEEQYLQNEYPQYPDEDYNQSSFEETDWEMPDYWSTQDHQ